MEAFCLKLKPVAACMVVARFVLASAGTVAVESVPLTNPSFEIDRFAHSPGYARAHEGGIAGWQIQGAVGINPTWQNPAQQTGAENAFADNGRIPHGRQILFMQNQAQIKQLVRNLKAGTKYRVTFRENGRAVQNSSEPPVLNVTFGGETVVSSHEVPPVDPNCSGKVPYARVESALFLPERDGDYELVFTTTRGGGTSLLLDNIAVECLD